VARNSIHVRDALPADAPVLVAMWHANTDTSGRMTEPNVAGAMRAIGHLALDPEQRLVVAEVEGEVVGVAHLVRAPLSPIHEETTVRVGHLFVNAEHRSRGVGRAMLSVATAWADEKQASHVMVNVSAAARDANRFLARLGLASIATVRAAPVGGLQQRLAKAEAAEAVDGQLVVERLRTVRRRQLTRQLTARSARRYPVD
jgi:GNAT superfamily N-acetyltransferase